MIKRILAVAVLAALGGCSSMPSGPSSAAGVWQGNLDNCRSTPISSQQMTITLRDGVMPGILIGEVHNEITFRGAKYTQHYSVSGASMGSQISVSPRQIFRNDNPKKLIPMTFKGTLVGNDTLTTDYCKMSKTFKKVSPAPAQAAMSAQR